MGNAWSSTGSSATILRRISLSCGQIELTQDAMCGSSLSRDQARDSRSVSLLTMSETRLLIIKAR